MALHYIQLTEIKDNVVTEFYNEGLDNLESYFDEMDGEFEDLAYRKNVTNTDDISTNDDGILSHYTCRRYCAVFICMRVCQDKFAYNDSDFSEEDKYWHKYNMYKDELSQLNEKITYEMITGTEAERSDRIGVMYALRG